MSINFNGLKMTGANNIHDHAALARLYAAIFLIHMCTKAVEYRRTANNEAKEFLEKLVTSLFPALEAIGGKLVSRLEVAAKDTSTSTSNGSADPAAVFHDDCYFEIARVFFKMYY